MRSLPVQLILGLTLCTFLPFVGSGLEIFNQYLYNGGSINIIISGVLVILTIATLYNIKRFPGITASSYLIPILTFWFILILFLVKVFNIKYSLFYYCSSSLLLLTYLYFIDIINRKKEQYIFAYIPVGRAKNIPEQLPSVDWLRLDTPLLDQNVNGIVTDLHSYDLNDEWAHFIAEKTLQGTPVYHHRNILMSQLPLLYVRLMMIGS